MSDRKTRDLACRTIWGCVCVMARVALRESERKEKKRKERQKKKKKK
jgi:hypothetical protein